MVSSPYARHLVAASVKVKVKVRAIAIEDVVVGHPLARTSSRGPPGVITGVERHQGALQVSSGVIMGWPHGVVIEDVGHRLVGDLSKLPAGTVLVDGLRGA